MRRGTREAALESFDRALMLQPDQAEVLTNRGVALHQLRRFDQALASYDRALAVEPDYAEALANSGNSLRELKRHDEALASYDRALAIKPDYVDALCNRGVVLYDLIRLPEALASYDRALAVRPDYAPALCGRGVALHGMKRFKEALASYDRALALWPDYAEALCNRGVTLHELGRFEEARSSYEQALAVRPGYAQAHCNLGVTLHELKAFDEALENYDRALAIRSDYAEAHFNEALCWLLLGDFARGLEKYEWRWECEQKREKRDFAQPLWLGSQEIAGRTILLHAEQGFGDTIQFCRYASSLAARGARVVLEVQRPLAALMRSLDGPVEVVVKGDPLPAFDMHCPLLSLPLASGTRSETIPAACPYLRAPLELSRQWLKRLGDGRPKIGVAWSGGPAHRHRSMTLETLAPLFAHDATFVSLQKEVPDQDAASLKSLTGLIHFGGALESFADTAAIIANLDLVISVDTGVAHLAGALAKPVWVLLAVVPDWRWGLERHDSPWYPTARLFRQDASRRWDSVVARLRDTLHELF
jgi:tetratricopeptide (TPR) repeat protein